MSKRVNNSNAGIVKTNQVANPQTTIPTEDYVSKRFEAVAPIRLDTNSDNYVEYLLGGKARKIK